MRWVTKKLEAAWTELACIFGKRMGGELIWNREWDICCILDGCRVDTFEEVYDGETDVLRSVASTSGTWIPRTFSDQDVSRIAYITGNPYAADLDPKKFANFHLEPVIETRYGIETVPPKALTDNAIDIWRNRNEMGIDKMVIHYMQPHVPFRSKPEWFDQHLGTESWGSGIWWAIAEGQISRSELLSAYRDNLEWVLGDDGVKMLKRSCDGTIALTADHGNAAGEWHMYGHPRGGVAPSIRNVPWATIDGSDTGEYKPTITDTKEFNVDNQLSALGYI